MLINSIEEGGLKLQSLKTKIESLKFKWIPKLLDDRVYKPWKSYITQKFKEPVNMILLGNLRNIDMPIVTDKFYNSIFQMWAKLNFHEPTKPEEVLKQMIWNNSHIKVGNKTVYSKKMADKKILYIQDLLNKDGKFANKVELEQKFDIVFRFFEYESLNQAIPKKWKQIVEDDNYSKNMINK